MKSCLSVAPKLNSANLTPPSLNSPSLNSPNPTIPSFKSATATPPSTRRRTSFLTFEPTPRRIKVSLHQLVNDLLASLQPLTKKRNNVIHNGVPQGICFIAEENLLAYVIWNLLGSIVHTKQNESIHVQALVDDDHTTIAFKDAGSWLTRSIAAEFPKWQMAAARIGGRINVNNDGVYGSQLAFSIPNTRLAV